MKKNNLTQFEQKKHLDFIEEERLYNEQFLTLTNYLDQLQN